MGRINRNPFVLAISVIIDDLINKLSDTLTLIKGYSQISLFCIDEGKESIKENLNEAVKATDRCALLLGKLEGLSKLLEGDSLYFEEGFEAKGAEEWKRI